MASPLASNSASSSHSSPASSAPQQQAVKKDLDLTAPSSEVEVLDERNGSPAPPAKRKAQDDAESKSKKAKASTSTPGAKSVSKKSSDENAVASSSKKPISSAKGESPLVELKNGKFVKKEKPLKLCDANSGIGARLAFNVWSADLFKDGEAKITEWPKEHWSVVAALIHESPQTLAGLVTSTKNAIVAYIETSMQAAADSQEDDDASSTIADRIPSAPLKALIESLASRNNYGLEASDLPEGLPEGVADIPASLQLPSWEVHDDEFLPAEFETKLAKRKADRVQMKSLAVELFLALPSSEQTDLLLAKKSAKGKGAANAASSSVAGTPVSKKRDAASSSATKPVKEKAVKRAKKEKTAEEVAEEEEKVKVKAEKEKEKEVKRVAKEKAAKEKEAKAAEKEAKKAAKAKEEAEKVAKEEKAMAAKKKQTSMLMGFFQKKSQSPALEAVAKSVTPKKSQASDFDKVFHPFTVRSGVTQAPVNGFAKARRELPEVMINGDQSLTAADAIASFLSDAAKHRIPPYNPHPEPPVSVRQHVQAIHESLVTGLDSRSYYNDLKDRKKVQVKFFKFREDVRPGYVGTWSKTSRTIGPRTPWTVDRALLNYDVDSEEEWEEEVDDPDAEDVQSGGERSDDEGEESEALSDDWMCDDDEVEFEPGHDGEDEVMLPPPGEDDDLVIMEDSSARRKIMQREKKAKAAREGQKKKKMVGLLLPTIKGLVWEETIGSTPYVGFSNMRIEMLNGAPIGLDPLRYVSKSFIAPSAAASGKGKGKAVEGQDVKPDVAAGSSPGASTSATEMTNPIPDHLMPKFISLVHRSDKPKPLLVAHAKEGLQEVAGDLKITKVMVEKAIAAIPILKIKGEGDKRQVWTVPKETMDQFSNSAQCP